MKSIRSTTSSSPRHLWRGLPACAVLGLFAALMAAGAPAAGEGTTLIDRLQPQSGEVRLLPSVPRYGAWGIRVGDPGASEQARGVQIEKNGQGVVYPTIELLTGAQGTIKFMVVVSTPPAADDQTARVLLDSWAISGPSRFLLTLQGTQLTLAVTDDQNKTATVGGNVNWQANGLYKVVIMWGGQDLTLMVENTVLGKAEKPALPAREPLGIVLGNNRDFNAPAKLAVSDLRLSTEREPIDPRTSERADGGSTTIETQFHMSQAYNRRLYPLLDRLRQTRGAEVDFAYALAYSDIGDMDRALRTVTPIARDQKHPLYAQAAFLRAELLTKQHSYFEADEQLQMLETSKDITTVVSAKVKRAAIQYEQGNKPEAQRLIGLVIAQYSDLSQISDAYLLIGLDQFKAGNYLQAFKAFQTIGVPGAPPRRSAEIGKDLDIKVSDTDLTRIEQDVKLPVTVTSYNVAGETDREVVLLKSAFSKGVYVGSILTALGQPKPGDGVLQVLGGDSIRIAYTDRLTNDPEKIERVIEAGVGLKTDAELTLVARSALDVYREVKKYMDQGLLDDRGVLIGELPDTASEFFRNPETGMLYWRGWRFDPDYLRYIKPGQSAYVELIEPDADTTSNPDKIKVKITTRGGKQLTVELVETGAHTGVFAATVPTAPTDRPAEGALEVGTSDALTVSYTDGTPAEGATDKVHVSSVEIRPAAGELYCGMEVKDYQAKTVFKSVSRVPQTAPMVIKLKDRDLDASDAPDAVTVNLAADSGAQLALKLTETGGHTGIFSSPLKVTTAAEAGPTVLVAKPGDLVAIAYVDEEAPKGKETRTLRFRVNTPEDATLKLFRQVVELPEGQTEAAARERGALPKITWEETTTLVPGCVYRADLADGDILDVGYGTISQKILVKTNTGAWAEVSLEGRADSAEFTTRFQGQFYVRLGDKNSPTAAFVSQTGAVVDVKDESRDWTANLAMRALNVQGNDKVTAIYFEPLSAAGLKDVKREYQLRVAADAKLKVVNAKGNPIDLIKPGMPFDVEIEDGNGDVTPKRDTIAAALVSSIGDKLVATLTETDIHSGVFTAEIKTASGAAPVQNDVLEVPFEGSIAITYEDAVTIVGTPATCKVELVARPMAEAEAMLLTKVYDDPKFEVETLVRLGESLYAVGAAKLASTTAEPGKPRMNAELKEAARLLERVIERFPTSGYVVESLYLTGKILLEEQKYDEAYKLFTRIIDDYPDSDFVQQVLFQLVVLYLERNDIDDATETAVKLVHGYAKSPLVADAFLRIAEYYYKKEQHVNAANIYKRVMERFPDNPRIELIHYRMATAYYRAGRAGDAGASQQAANYYLAFAEVYPDHELADDALYWAASALYYQQPNPGEINASAAYKVLTRELLDYPTGDMADYAKKLRGVILERFPRSAEQ